VALSSGIDPETAVASASLNQHGLRYLDGMRGIAVLAVMAWHYTNWDYEKFLPYGTHYAAIPVLDHGWIGVNIFFCISGFVILMTLERCQDFGEFMARRWSRLFPAMLFASLLVFSASQVIGQYMPHGRAAPVNLLPGLTFIIPPFWQALLGRPVDELDGVYWTLYVEMGFYVVFGLAYARLGWRRGLMALATIWLLTIIASRVASSAQLPWLATAITPLQWIGAEYYGWFVSGALFYKASAPRLNALFAAALVAGVISAFTSDLWPPGDLESRIYLTFCLLFFALAQRSRVIQRGLSTRWLLFAGAVSYPLYLLHNELGIGLIGLAGTLLPPTLWMLIPFFCMGLMLCLAWCVVTWIESPATARLRTGLLRLTGTRAEIASD